MLTSWSAALACKQARSTRAPDGGRMNAFNTRDSLQAQSFKALLDGALDLLFRRLKIVEGSAGDSDYDRLDARQSFRSKDIAR